jgi:hypothetical protein
MFMTSEIDFREFAGSVGTIKDYEDGDAIFREGDHPAFMYVVLSGAVDIAAQNKRLERIGAGKAWHPVAFGRPATHRHSARQRYNTACGDRPQEIPFHDRGNAKFLLVCDGRTRTPPAHHKRRPLEPYAFIWSRQIPAKCTKLRVKNKMKAFIVNGEGSQHPKRRFWSVSILKHSSQR